MPAGRKPKPTHLKILDGSAAKHPERVNRNEPQPLKKPPVRPDYLDDYGNQAWDELVSQLDQMGLLTRAEGSILELYAQTYSQYRTALLHMKKLGQVLVTLKGSDVEVRRNPFTVEVHKCRDAMNKMLLELGMTPTARTRIQVAPKEDDEDNRFFGRQG